MSTQAPTISSFLGLQDPELRTLSAQCEIKGFPKNAIIINEGERTDSTRDDVTRPSLGQQLALDQAPDPASGHFRVPKIL